MSEHVLVANHCYASTQRWTALLCDSVSHVSVWSAAMPLFPFPGRLGIIQGKAGRQTQGGEAAKNLTYYREVRLLLFAVTFRLSGLGALLLLFFFFFPSGDCVLHWKSIFSGLAFLLPQNTTFYLLLPIWTILSFPLCLSLLDILCCAS